MRNFIKFKDEHKRYYKVLFEHILIQDVTRTLCCYGGHMIYKSFFSVDLVTTCADTKLNTY